MLAMEFELQHNRPDLNGDLTGLPNHKGNGGREKKEKRIQCLWFHGDSHINYPNIVLRSRLSKVNLISKYTSTITPAQLYMTTMMMMLHHIKQ